MKSLIEYIYEANSLVVKFSGPRDGAYGNAFPENGDEVSFTPDYKGDMNNMVVKVTRGKIRTPNYMYEVPIGTFPNDPNMKAKERKEKAAEIYLNWLKENPVDEIKAGGMGPVLQYLTDNGLKPRTGGRDITTQELIYRGMGSQKKYFKTVGEVDKFLEENFEIEEIKRGRDKGIKVQLDGNFLFQLSMKGNRIIMEFQSGESKQFNSAEELFYHIGVACHTGKYGDINNNLMAWSSGRNWSGTEW